MNSSRATTSHFKNRESEENYKNIKDRPISAIVLAKNTSSEKYLHTFGLKEFRP